jgi:hypothetical protein
MLGSRKPLTLKRALMFLQDGEPRTVDIGAPMPVERDGKWVVLLMDLWVATMLPGDIFDLTFRILTSSVASESDPAFVVDGMVFAGGYVVIATRELWWSDPAGIHLAGVCPRAIVVSDRAERAHTQSAQTPAARSGPSVLDLRRLLPSASLRYPAIEWRDASRTGT